MASELKQDSIDYARMRNSVIYVYTVHPDHRVDIYTRMYYRN